MSNPPVQLLLLDDHTLFRVMLKGLLDTDPAFHVVAHCSVIADALRALAAHRIDLVLLDHDLGNNGNGFQFIRAARDTGYHGRIILVTAGMSDPDYVRALRDGVSGIFLKQSSPELLLEAIGKVMAGETWMDQHCLQALAGAIESDSGATPRRHEPTDRELQILRGVFEGLSNKQIGAGLNISEASVKSGLQQLFLKTGVRTRSQLVRVALEEYASAWGLRV